ncbi:lytic murein transglycosylase [Patescibacteria group bacterium]
MNKVFKRYILVGILIVGLLSSCLPYVNAQTGQQAVDNRRAQLEAELADLEKEITAQRNILTSKQREKVSLERDVAILDAQINEATLSIRARNLSIQRLTSDIGGKEKIIGSLTDKLLREKESLAQLIRKTNEIDSFSLVEVVLSEEDLSEFFVDIDSFQSIKESLSESFEEIEITKEVTTEQKNTLEDKKNEEVELRTIQELEKRRIEDKRGERNALLKVTKGQESVYKRILSEKEQSASEIRNALFALRDTAPIPFGEALEYANKAYKKTGVRPAFLLGIITQESNLGENTGQCLLTNSPQKGDGKGKNTGRFFSGVMKGSRDVDPFMAISKRVGFDPFNTPVSCPPSYGYGGAMGPAQFIPSTWILFEDKVAKLTGHNPPNPWNPEDAFMASALLLKDNGAARSVSTCILTNDPEKCAALRYFAGWKNANKSAYQFYGNGVMDLAAKWQRQIDILQGN